MRLPDVVYIDDNEFNRLMIKKNVSDHFNMHVLSSAKELYSLLENYVPRVLLLDLIMPDESGFDVLKNFLRMSFIGGGREQHLRIPASCLQTGCLQMKNV